MRVRCVRCRPIGSSTVPPPVMTPRHSARYSRTISRAASCATSPVCASGVRATTRSPVVSLSRRCTSPARGTTASLGSSASSAFCRVWRALAAAGSCARMRTCSPPRTLSLARSAGPSTSTAPASIQDLRRAREYCGSARARAWSNRSPAASAGSRSACERNSPGAAAVGPPEFVILPALTRREATERPFQMRLSVPVRGGLVALCIVMLGLAGCHPHRIKDERKLTPEALYKKAHKSMEAYDFNGAIKGFEALTARFPFTDEARQARLDLIYSYYRAGEKESATDAAETFIRENPTHPRVDYAWYVKGL